jgi:hypothetical protein
LTRFAQFPRQVTRTIFVFTSWAYPPNTWLIFCTSPRTNLPFRNLTAAGGDEFCTSLVHRALVAAAAASNFASFAFFSSLALVLTFLSSSDF